MFNNIKIDKKAMEEKTDRLGGGYQTIPSGIYPATIQTAYATQSKNGAKGLVVKYNVNVEGTERPYTQTFWVTNRNGDVYYEDRNGNRHNLAGFNHANHLCALLTGNPINEVAMEEGQVMLYNVDAGKEILTTVPVLPDLTDKDVYLAIINRRVNKQEKDGSGNYVDIAEERMINEIEKVFLERDGAVYTFDELRNELPAEFAEKWSERWSGKVDDRYKEVKESGSSSKPSSSGAKKFNF